jgi:hypothetical protein
MEKAIIFMTANGWTVRNRDRGYAEFVATDGFKVSMEYSYSDDLYWTWEDNGLEVESFGGLTLDKIKSMYAY